MRLEAEQARDIVWGDDEDWEEVSEKQIESQSRWSLYYSQVFQHIPTNRFYEFCWGEGATEMQEMQPFEYDNFVEPTEVVQQQVVQTVWVPKE